MASTEAGPRRGEKRRGVAASAAVGKGRGDTARRGRGHVGAGPGGWAPEDVAIHVRAGLRLQGAGGGRSQAWWEAIGRGRGAHMGVWAWPCGGIGAAVDREGAWPRRG